jgi:glycosyltransferase involved in cell wall biosynthesis
MRDVQVGLAIRCLSRYFVAQAAKMNQEFVVGFDAKRAFSNASGLGHYARNHIRMLARALPAERIVLFSPCLGRLDFRDEMRAAGIRIVSPSSPSGTWRTLGMGKEVKKQGVSVFHALSPELPFDLDVPAIVTVHDAIAFDVPAYHSFWNALLYRFKIRHALRRASMVVSVSRYTAGRLQDQSALMGKTVEVLPPVFQPSLIPATTPIKSIQPYFLYVGNLEARKNIGMLLEAFLLIRKRVPHHLVLVGKDLGMRSSLMGFIKNMGLTGRVHLTGEISEGEKNGWIQHCDALVYPSVMEGFGLPVLEGLMAQKPVITSSGTAMEEAGGDCVYYASPYQPEEWAETLIRILENPMPLNAEECQSHLQKFSPERLIPAWLGLYSLVANGN